MVVDLVVAVAVFFTHFKGIPNFKPLFPISFGLTIRRTSVYFGQCFFKELAQISGEFHLRIPPLLLPDLKQEEVFLSDSRPQAQNFGCFGL